MGDDGLNGCQCPDTPWVKARHATPLSEKSPSTRRVILEDVGFFVVEKLTKLNQPWTWM